MPVVRVRCEGCGEVGFNPHATGDDADGEPAYVFRCRCGSETATFYDVAPARTLAGGLLTPAA